VPWGNQTDFYHRANRVHALPFGGLDIADYVSHSKFVLRMEPLSEDFPHPPVQLERLEKCGELVNEVVSCVTALQPPEALEELRPAGQLSDPESPGLLGDDAKALGSCPSGTKVGTQDSPKRGTTWLEQLRRRVEGPNFCGRHAGPVYAAAERVWKTRVGQLLRGLPKGLFAEIQRREREVRRRRSRHSGAVLSAPQLRQRRKKCTLLRRVGVSARKAAQYPQKANLERLLQAYERYRDCVPRQR